MFKIIFSLLFLCVQLFFKQAECQVRSHRATVDIQIPVKPVVVNIGGQRSVYYELHLVNFTGDTIEIKRLDVLYTTNSSIIYQLDGAELRARLSSIARPARDSILLMSPGDSGVIFIEIALAGNGRPGSFTHRIAINVLKSFKKIAMVIAGATTEVVSKPPVLLGHPLTGGPWAAVYDPLWPRGHRRVFYTVNGTARLPGRFAIDLIKLDSEGKLAAGDENVIGNWHGYAADVLAVDNGVITSVKNDADESQTLSDYIPPLPENATGNYISLKIGDRRYVFYEHLKPGSIRVKAGQAVSKGQVIASLGFTGQTTGPHLHLHVADRDSPLGAEGIPFEFEQYDLLGRYADFSNFGKALWTPAGTRRVEDVRSERPASNSVIEFHR